MGCRMSSADDFHVWISALPLNRDRAVFQLDLPYVRPVDALAALEHAVSPRTYALSERFTPLVGLKQFEPAFNGSRFRFRCPVGRPQS
jgi:hypothetical protein